MVASEKIRTGKITVESGALAPRRAQAGRPPRITREQIAAATLKIGLDRATIRVVAEELGVSVPGLYHHVRTREQLLEMALAHSFKLLPATVVKSDPWDVTLTRYARDIYEHLLTQPEIINFINAGAMVTSGHALHLDMFIEGAMKIGLSPQEAYGVFAHLMAAIIGAAALEARDREITAKGDSLFGALRKQCEQLPPSETVYLRKLLQPATARVPDRFAAVEDMIASLALRYQGTIAARTQKAGENTLPEATLKGRNKHVS